MWNITVFNNGKDLRMYEFNTEKEAKISWKVFKVIRF